MNGPYRSAVRPAGLAQGARRTATPQSHPDDYGVTAELPPKISIAVTNYLQTGVDSPKVKRPSLVEKILSIKLYLMASLSR
jgi:hypothetical protein